MWGEGVDSRLKQARVLASLNLVKTLWGPVLDKRRPPCWPPKCGQHAGVVIIAGEENTDTQLVQVKHLLTKAKSTTPLVTGPG